MVNAGNNDYTQEESKETQPSGDCIDDLVTQIREFLQTQRNDGNKTYEIMALSKTFMGVPLPLGTSASAVL